MKTTIGQRVRQARLQRKLSQEQLAKLVPMSQNSLSNLETGRNETSLKLGKIARVLGKRSRWIEFGEMPEDENPSIRSAGSDLAVVYPPDLRLPVAVPVVGTIQGGKEGFVEQALEAIGPDVREVPYYGKDPEAYALRVRGDSMADRIVSGDRLVIEPGTTPEPGDIALVKMRDGRCAVRQLLYIRDGEVTLGAFNRTDPNMLLPMVDVAALQKVVQIIPR